MIQKPVELAVVMWKIAKMYANLISFNIELMKLFCCRANEFTLFVRFRWFGRLDLLFGWSVRSFICLFVHLWHLFFPRHNFSCLMHPAARTKSFQIQIMFAKHFNKYFFNCLFVCLAFDINFTICDRKLIFKHRLK